MAGHFGTKHNRTPVCKVCGIGPKYRAGYCRSHYFQSVREEKALKRQPRLGSCGQCGQAIRKHTTMQKYCSYRCSATARNQRERKYQNPATVGNCPHCRKTFHSRKPWQKFCSDLCSNKHRSQMDAKPRKPAALIDAVCEACGKQFTKLRRHYYKGISVKRKPKFCSITCAYRARRGDASPKYRGGVVTYRGARWLEIAEEIRGRDGNLCCVCQSLPKSQRKHTVDHVVPFRLMHRWGLNPNHYDNLVTVCGSCHGRKQTVEDRLLKGDVIGFLRGLSQLGYAHSCIRGAMATAGLSTRGLD